MLDVEAKGDPAIEEANSPATSFMNRPVR